MKLRFRLTTLLAAILLVTLGLAAVRSLSDLWVSATFTAAVVVLSAAAVGGIAAPEPSRSSWAGMAVFGWVYLGIVFGPWPDADRPPPLLTVPLLKVAEDHLFSDGKTPYLTFRQVARHDDDARTTVWGTSRNMPPGPAPPGGYKVIDLTAYRQVGHSLSALLFGLLGGLVGRYFATRDDAR